MASHVEYGNVGPEQDLRVTDVFLKKEIKRFFYLHRTLRGIAIFDISAFLELLWNCTKKKSRTKQFLRILKLWMVANTY